MNQPIFDYERAIQQINETELDPIFRKLLDNMDQGVLLLNKQGSIQYANQPAKAYLQLRGENEPVKIRSLMQGTNSMETAQHVVTIGEREELIVGQHHAKKDQQLFLMSFYQPHLPDIGLQSNSTFNDLVGQSDVMLSLKELIKRIAPGPSSVLINGESGTGKEVIASVIHRLSNRAQNPFIAINCAAIPDQLLESELFGYTKGAFTGASSKGRVGLIQAANKGTLFLDEIGDMSLSLQAKLLRVLENREIMPVGANKAVPVDIRIISATNRDFAERIDAKEFREDLYYRLNVIPLYLPKLCDRPGDVHLLINYFMEIHTRKLGVAYPGITQEALALLDQYSWPGNVRELSNLVEYLINIVSEGQQITEQLLPPHIASIAAKPARSPMPKAVTENSNASLEDMEKQRIADAISRLSSRQQVADELGIGIATLYRKIKKYGL